MTLTEEQRGTVAFDLEKARAGISHYRIENPSNVDTECALKELVDQANLAEDALAEIERLRAENLELQVAVFGPDGIRAHQACIIADQAARISELEIEIAELKADLEQSERVIEARLEVIDDQAARIKELEDALVEEREKTVLNNRNSAPVEFFRDAKKWRYDEAIRQLRAEGKIGPDASKPRSWQITDERKATLSASLKVLERLKKNNTDTDHSYLDRGITVLRAMLEAGL